MDQGLTGYIAQLSMYMSQQSAVNGASMKMLTKTMDAAKTEGSQLIEAIQEIPPPAETSGTGSLLDVRA